MSKYKIRVIRTDGTTEHVELASEPPLAMVQKWVGGLVEPVRGYDVDVFVDEEGYMTNKPVNENASTEFGIQLRGDVVVYDEGKMT